MVDEDRLADELASLKLDRGDAKPMAARARASTNGRRGSGLAFAIAAVLLAGVGVGGYYIFREGSGRIFAQEVELGSVTLMSPAQSDVTLVATGYVYARKKANVSPKVGGRLAKLYVDEGSVVKEDQVLAELESADVQAQLQQLRADIVAAKAKVERARADLADATLKFNREKQLLAKEAGTQMAYDDAKMRVEAATTALTAAEADVQSVEARHKAVSVALENTKVRAPFSGTILRKLAEAGETIAPFTLNGVFTMASLDDLEVQADVAEAQFHKVQVGTPAEIILDAYPDKRFRGVVSEVRQMVDRSKAAVTVKVRFTDNSKGVLPDMAAKVSFLAKALDDAALKAAPKLVAPADAVVDRGGKKVLFTIEDGHAHEIPVSVKGPFGSSGVELADGPTTGTRVIRRPDEKIRDGVAVKEKKS